MNNGRKQHELVIKPQVAQAPVRGELRPYNFVNL